MAEILVFVLISCLHWPLLPVGDLHEVVHGFQALRAKVIGLLHREHGILEVRLSRLARALDDLSNLPRDLSYVTFHKLIHALFQSLIFLEQFFVKQTFAWVIRRMQA